MIAEIGAIIEAVSVWNNFRSGPAAKNSVPTPFSMQVTRQLYNYYDFFFFRRKET
jgi:hypothetical protein